MVSNTKHESSDKDAQIILYYDQIKPDHHYFLLLHLFTKKKINSVTCSLETSGFSHP